MNADTAPAITDKRIMDLVQVQRAVNVWRMKGDRIVFTNGCFDILHRGHVEYLQEAAALGDRLIIGVNSDASVRRLGKAPDRPLNDEVSRAKVLCALRLVDAVIIFDQDTPLELIQAIGPDILVKGGDWTEDRIVGADIVKARGGEVHSLKLVDGFSTTALVERIRHGR
ncbi:MAG TPA: D-glycero-beta-D-manno-heptose 1-phosphate adenylyltransferase [Flavobacteriales bacterium]|jgi:rfaE bifunctional protein nucleotidyltransferase chain/domain|nr:D-glycero-beta-D-manno-heptose 1-phosphate adenylyltransferase [Flavobacteriales bacterium]